MFTGIIQAVGKVSSLELKLGDARLRIQTNDLDLSNVALGDSIATNGVCLTVAGLPGDGYWADVSKETLAFTTLGDLKQGVPVNLEKALTPASMLGGHIVSGHVDGVAEVISRHSDGRSERFRLKVPSDLAKYIAHKGSVCIDGVSLTVNEVENSEFEVNIVPHTIEKTIFREYVVKTRVNIEVDVIARYLERLVTGNTTLNSKSRDISLDNLKNNGFL